MHLHHGVMLSLKTDIMKFEGKLIELGKIILSEAAQTQKYKKWYVFIHKWREVIKQVVNKLHSVVWKRLDKKEGYS